MKPKHRLIQAGLALALAFPLWAPTAPVSHAAETGSGALALRDPRTASLLADPSSIQPTPGTISPQSVNPGATWSSLVQPPSTTPQPPAAGSPGPTSAATFQVGSIQAETAPSGKPARAGSLIVKFRGGLQTATRSDAHQQVRSQAVEPVGTAGAVRVQVAPGTLAQAMSVYAARNDVERVEPDYLLYADMVPNDPRYGDTWGLPKIQAPAAWARVGGAAGVRVAVLDTGIANHPDLSGRVVASRDFTESPYGPNDHHGHGTHVAGTVAANANNGVGVVGVAWNASLLNAKVLGDGGAGSFSSVANGIVWAADNGAKVISMSLGADLDCPGVIQDAITYATSRGAVIVAAAGNDGMNDVHTPANCIGAVPVGAVNSNDGRPGFSNYGMGVPIAAPGEMILSTGKAGDYVWMTGTSMATPHAAGVAALIWASSHGTSNHAVVSRLFSTADKIAGTGSIWSHGRINASAAVSGASGGGSPPPPASPPPPPPPPTPPVACSPRPPVTLKSAPSGPGVLRVTVSAGASSSGANRLKQLRFGPSNNAIIEVGARAEAGNFTINLPSAAPEYTFTVRRAAASGAVTVPVTVVDNCGEWSTFVGGGPNAF